MGRESNQTSVATKTNVASGDLGNPGRTIRVRDKILRSGGGGRVSLRGRFFRLVCNLTGRRALTTFTASGMGNLVNTTDACPIGTGHFPATRWSVITSAREGDEESLADLCEGYHPPVVAFFRAAGFSFHDAEDLAQGFFADILRRGFLRHVTDGKGRFRTFLLRSLQHHLCDHLDKTNALKRGGGRKPASLSETGPEGEPPWQPPDPGPTPEQAFERAWVGTIIANALAQVERECEHTGKRALLEELEPVLHQDADAPRYHEIASRLGTTEGAVKAAAKRIRDRLQWLIRDQVKRTLRDETQCETEIHDLMAAFRQASPPARPTDK